MANVLVNEQHLKDIADAVRSKLGTTEKMLPANMARGINLISTGSPEAEEMLMLLLNRPEKIEYDYDEEEEIIINKDELEKISNLNWPKDLSMIGAYAFYNNSALALTSLPESLTEIGAHAFDNCRNLALTSLPESLTYIGLSAFENCRNLAITSLPESLTYIGYAAFMNCYNLAITSLPENAEYKELVFDGCENLALTSLPEKWTKISRGLFRGCENLALTSLPAGVTEIGARAFDGCRNLAITSLPEGLTEIKGGTFDNCRNLALTSLPEGLTKIDYEAFRGCENLALTSLPAGVTEIGYRAFADTSCSFDNIVFSPDKYIYDCAFSGCNLQTVTINGNNYDYEFFRGFVESNIDTLIFNGDVFNGENNYTYFSLHWLADFNTSIKEIIFNIDYYDGFENHLDIRHCCNEIYSFNKYFIIRELSECNNLTTMNFKDGVSIQEWSIGFCSNLNTINIYLSEQNITEIKESAFHSCSSPLTINIIGPSDAVNKGMITINKNAFISCDQSITINVPWSEGAVPNAPWGATNATVNYNYTGE